MTEEQRIARNLASGEGVRRSWQDPVKRANRIEGMRRSWDDPLTHALRSAILIRSATRERDERRRCETSSGASVGRSVNAGRRDRAG
jgi:hypothetical protein